MSSHARKVFNHLHSKLINTSIRVTSAMIVICEQRTQWGRNATHLRGIVSGPKQTRKPKTTSGLNLLDKLFSIETR